MPGSPRDSLRSQERLAVFTGRYSARTGLILTNLLRNETGDWVWSSDEEGDSDDETIQKKGIKASKQVSKSEESLPENQRTINLVLRMRNTKRELNDIRFEFQPTKVTMITSNPNL